MLNESHFGGGVGMILFSQNTLLKRARRQCAVLSCNIFWASCSNLSQVIVLRGELCFLN